MTPRIHRGLRVAVAVAVLSAIGAAMGTGASAASASAPARASGSASSRSATLLATTQVQAFMTLYGYADNSPPGTDIAHPCLHSQAGGTGTYADPITFATDVAELGWCQIIYVPYMQRYFIHEDECSQCDQTWNTLHLYRFDMWAGGDATSLVQPGRSALLGCESTWTRANSPTDPNNPTIEIDPPSNLPVVTAPIFTPPSTCWTPIAVTDPGNQLSYVGGAGVNLQVHATDTNAGQTLTYSATPLPAGLSIDAATGLITGSPETKGRAKVTVTASDAYDSASVRFLWKVKALRVRRR